MRVAIIDDCEICRKEIQSCLDRYFRENYAGDLPVIEEYESGEIFLRSFAAESYDLVFIDQYMKEISGIDTAKGIRAQDALVALVFVTASRDYAVESYEVRACGYLVKPYDYADFERTMRLARMDKFREARFIRLEQDKILLREILWCDQDGHYVQIHTLKRGILRFRISFSELSSLLKFYPQFLTCYKGCVVNMEHVARMEGVDFILDTGGRVPFSKRDKCKIQALFRDYLFQKEREEELLY